MTTPIAAGCGPGRTMVNGVCVARTTIRQTRPQVRAMAGRRLRSLPVSPTQKTDPSTNRKPVGILVDFRICADAMGRAARAWHHRLLFNGYRWFLGWLRGETRPGDP